MPIPIPPATLSGVIASRQVFLYWPRAAGGVSFNVKRSTVHNGPYTTVGSILGSSRRLNPPLTKIEYCDASELIDGTTYYYVVTSVESGIESGASPELALTPGAIPSPPGSISVTPGNTQNSLTWSAPAGATSYKLWRSATHGGPYTLVVAQAGTSYVDTGLTNGTTYYYTFSALNANGEGAMSDESSGTPSGSGFPAMTAANQTSGDGPLGVFFSAVDEASPIPFTSGVVQPGDGDFGKYDYKWDFGDGASGNWNTDSRSRNKAIGYCAAHVYEFAGTYTVTLTVTKDDNTVVVYTQTITVNAWSGSTRYVSASGNDSNDGLTTGTPWQTLAKVFANQAANRRFLFNRGDTFTTTTGGFNASSQGELFGAYGTGAKPIFSCSNTSIVQSMIFTSNSDIRFMDINMIGPGAADPVGAISISGTFQSFHILMFRLDASLWRVAFGNSDSPVIYTTPSSGIVMADCTVDQPQVNGVFIGGQKLSIIGNSFTNCATSHLLRMWQTHNGCVSNNYFDNPGATRFCIKMHAQSEAGRPETQFAYVSFNKARNGQAWCFVFGPEDTVTGPEMIHDVVVDSNDFISGANFQVQAYIKIFSSRFVVRNNWGDCSNSKYMGLVDIEKNPLIAVPDNIRIYNNTLYKSNAQSGNAIEMVTINSTDIGAVIVRNNLLSTPMDPTSLMIAGTCGGLVQDHNLRSDTPGFVDVTTDNFHLLAGSPAIGAGVQNPAIRKDYDGIARPLSAAPDIGAYQF